MDLAEFERIGLDPDTTQARDHGRMCAQPGCTKLTFNQMGGCDRHYIQRPDKVQNSVGSGSGVDSILV